MNCFDIYIYIYISFFPYLEQDWRIHIVSVDIQKWQSSNVYIINVGTTRLIWPAGNNGCTVFASARRISASGRGPFMRVRLKTPDRIVHHRAYDGKEAVKLRNFRSGTLQRRSSNYFKRSRGFSWINYARRPFPPASAVNSYEINGYANGFDSVLAWTRLTYAPSPVKSTKTVEERTDCAKWSIRIEIKKSGWKKTKQKEKKKIYFDHYRLIRQLRLRFINRK